MPAEPTGQSADPRAVAAFRDALARGDDAGAERLAASWPGGDAHAPPEVHSFLALRALDAGDPGRARACAERGLAAHSQSALLAFQLGRA